MGFFKKIGKMAKKRMSFKNLVKYANPLNMMNPAFHVKELKQNFNDVRNLAGSSTSSNNCCCKK